MQQVFQFGGKTFEAEKDGKRLTGQLNRVRELMSDGKWRTLAEIQSVVGGSEAGVSARLRDLRKHHFGGLTVERRLTVERQRRTESGLFEYRVLTV